MLSEFIRVCLVTNARSINLPSNVYRLEDCVLVSYRSLCGERKINGSMVHLNTGLTYSQYTTCNGGAKRSDACDIVKIRNKSFKNE